MSVDGELLFCGRRRNDRATLSDLLRHYQQAGVGAEVDRIPVSDFDKYSDDEIADTVSAKLLIEPINLLRAEGEGKVTEKDIEVHSHWDGRVQVPGLHVVHTVPFTGDADLFELKPDTFDLNPPRGTVRGSTIVVGIGVRANEQQAAIDYIKGTLDNIEQNIERQKGALNAYNDDIRAQVFPAVQARRAKLQAASSLSNKLKGL